MATLDKYRPPDYDAPTNPHSRWAFHIEPQAQQTGQSWTAWYPGADWTVTAPTKEAALQQLRDEFGRRLKESGYSARAFAFTDALYRRHLQDPVQGVYAMDVGVYNELRELGETPADLQEGFHEAEDRRVNGQPYTKEDYFRFRSRGG
ncbi:hypothetical protein [Mycobacterium xenopi]|uniref:hypothetical protein n=1 Tax=Mycobacterium xenopi TaxID=1789 RepID=UPI000D9514DF|nr:hypothetical protein [Mycobacterium xenopi]SPX94908.1 Uncharacterised protein [Mycobacterium xenopi]